MSIKTTITSDDLILIIFTEQQANVFCQNQVVRRDDLDQALEAVRCPLIVGVVAAMYLIADDEVSEYDNPNNIYRQFDTVVQALLKETGFDRAGLKEQLQKTFDVMKVKWPREVETVQDAIPDVDAAIMTLIPLAAVYEGRVSVDFFDMASEFGVALTYVTPYYQRRPTFRSTLDGVPAFVPPHLRDEYRRRMNAVQRDMQGIWGLMGRIIYGSGQG